MTPVELKIVVPLVIAILASNGLLIKVIQWMMTKPSSQSVQIGPDLRARRGDTDPDLQVCSHHYQVIKDASDIRGDLQTLKEVTETKLSSIADNQKEMGKDVKALMRHTGAFRTMDERSQEG